MAITAPPGLQSEQVGCERDRVVAAAFTPALLAAIVGVSSANPLVTVPTTGATRTSVADIFRTACESGSIRLKASEARPALVSDLPPAVRHWFRYPASFKIYDLLAVGSHTYLITLSDLADRSGLKSVCAVATQASSAESLWASITGGMATRSGSDPARLTYSNRIDGYEIAVRELGGGYRIAQLSVFSDDKLRRFRDQAGGGEFHPGGERYFGKTGTVCPVPRSTGGGTGPTVLSSPADAATAALVRSFLSGRTGGIDTQTVQSSTITSCRDAALKLAAQPDCRPEDLFVVGDREIRQTWVCNGRGAYSMFFTVSGGRISNIWAVDHRAAGGASRP